MSDFADLLKKGLHELRYNISSEMLTAQLQYSLVEFARASGVLQEVLTVVDFPSTGYTVLVPTSGFVSTVRKVQVDGRLISKSLYTFIEATSEFFINQDALASGNTVELLCIVVPDPEYTGYPESFYRAYGPGIVGHACFELSVDSKEPWARVDRIPIFKQAYDRAVSEARRRNYKNFALRA